MMLIQGLAKQIEHAHTWKSDGYLTGTHWSLKAVETVEIIIRIQFDIFDELPSMNEDCIFVDNWLSEVLLF